MEIVKLPSGAELKITLSPFAVSKALYQVFLDEAKTVQWSAKTDVSTVLKDLACLGFSSPKIEVALKECFKKCLYCDKRGELKIDDDTFEPVEAREDYITVCMAVAKANIYPFAKSLYAEYGQYLMTMQSDQA